MNLIKIGVKMSIFGLGFISGAYYTKSKEQEEQTEVKINTKSKEESDKEDIFRCSLCNNSFDSERGLNIHKGRMHD